jgi:Uma2 family endonuclease
MPMSAVPRREKALEGEPAWEIAHLFPYQGAWTEEEYLSLSTNHLVELSDGRIEVLPTPTMSHQMIVVFLLRALLAFVEPRKLGTALVAGLPVRLWKGKIREPDIVFMLAENAKRMGERFWRGADLAMEVVSGGAKARKRDLETKAKEYARAGIAEYWIVDPKVGEITVLRLSEGQYVEHGRFGKGRKARSALLKGFSVSVDAALARK